MLVKCEVCGTERDKRPQDIARTKHNFCSRSCAVTFNNLRSPRRHKTKKCRLCDTLILSQRQYCESCNPPNKSEQQTLDDVMYRQGHPAYAHAIVRQRARALAKSLNWTACASCGYDRHIEIAHRKPISSFPRDTLVSVVNSPDNLLPLCPNCHWEFDNLNESRHEESSPGHEGTSFG